MRGLEIKRAVFRALTRLRVATIKSSTRLLGDAHHFRDEDPLELAPSGCHAIARLLEGRPYIGGSSKHSRPWQCCLATAAT